MLVPPTLRVCTHVCMRGRLYPRATGRAPKCVCLFVPAGMYVCMYAERTHLRGVLTGGAGLVLRNLGNSRVSNETLHDQLSATNATWVSATLYHALLLNFVCVRARACTYVFYSGVGPEDVLASTVPVVMVSLRLPCGRNNCRPFLYLNDVKCRLFVADFCCYSYSHCCC